MPSRVLRYFSVHKPGDIIVIILSLDLDVGAMIQLPFDVEIWSTRNEYLQGI